MRRICVAPGAFESWRAVRPMMMIREFGAGSAAGPMVPICLPPNRSPSWLAGAERSGWLRVGEA